MSDDLEYSTSVLLAHTLERILSNPNIKSGDRVLAAMSGGTDSSVMAAILHQAKLDVVGVSMQLFNRTHNASTIEPKSEGKCCTIDDFHDARRVAFQFGFPHYIINFEDKFKKAVISSFIDDYISGKTPSPCIRCNQHIKFDALLKTAAELDCNFIATGHYARIVQDARGYHLLKATDENKDQSYFLFTHNQKSLAQTLFPLDLLSKTQVRQIARYLGIHVAEKNDSQEICFVSGHYYDYIKQSRQLKITNGDIRHINGQLLGKHYGYWRFTVGQRKGIGISYSSPLFVIQVDPKTNIVWVGGDDDLLKQEFIATKISWCLEPPLNKKFSCQVKIRSRSSKVNATVHLLEDDAARIILEMPQRAIAPGQAVVFYTEDEILGGGWIDTQ